MRRMVAIGAVILLAGSGAPGCSALNAQSSEGGPAAKKEPSVLPGPLDQERVLANPVFTPGESSDFEFASAGRRLSGVFDLPATGDASAIVLFVHGYGKTNVREWRSFAELRRRFNEIEIATAVWDKPGQGRSEGRFDINQSVFSSAQEVIDAANYFRAINAPGSNHIGIWGVSRAGWRVARRLRSLSHRRQLRSLSRGDADAPSR